MMKYNEDCSEMSAAIVVVAALGILFGCIMGHVFYPITMRIIYFVAELYR